MSCSALMKNLMQQAFSGGFAKYNTRENFKVYSMQSPQTLIANGCDDFATFYNPSTL